MNQDLSIVTFGDEAQPARRQKLVDLLRACPIPDDELPMNLGLFLTPQTLSRVLFMDFLYRQVSEVQGVVMELGCRWGQNTALFTALRGIYEPFNRLRKVVAFDTFAGFPAVDEKDGPQMKSGGYAVSENYADYLAAILDVQEKESPQAHLKKYEIVRGDVSETLPAYFESNPETVVALAYFDLDLYRPTLEALPRHRGPVDPRQRDRVRRGQRPGHPRRNHGTHRGVRFKPLPAAPFPAKRPHELHRD